MLPVCAIASPPSLLISKPMKECGIDKCRRRFPALDGFNFDPSPKYPVEVERCANRLAFLRMSLPSKMCHTAIRMSTTILHGQPFRHGGPRKPEILPQPYNRQG